MHSDLWRGFLQQHQQSLKHQVGEARSDGDVVQQALDVVHHHTAELRLICVVKDLKQREDGERDEWTKERQTDAGRHKWMEKEGEQLNRLDRSMSRCLHANALLFAVVP